MSRLWFMHCDRLLLFFILSCNFISLGSVIGRSPAGSFGGLNTVNDERWAQHAICQGVEQRWSQETEEASPKAPIHTQILPPRASDEIWTYVFAITIHRVLSSLLCRQLVWLGSVQQLEHSKKKPNKNKTNNEKRDKGAKGLMHDAVMCVE